MEGEQYDTGTTAAATDTTDNSTGSVEQIMPWDREEGRKLRFKLSSSESICYYLFACIDVSCHFLDLSCKRLDIHALAKFVWRL